MRIDHYSPVHNPVHKLTSLGMGQIFRRIKRIAKSHTNDFGSHDAPAADNQDEELHRIIDELNDSKLNDGEPDDNESNDSKTSDNKAKDNAEESPFGSMTYEKANAILGVSHNSTAKEIKSAYLNKIKEYHPDKVASLGDELKQLAEKKTLEINLAYQFLTKA